MAKPLPPKNNPPAKAAPKPKAEPSPAPTGRVDKRPEASVASVSAAVAAAMMEDAGSASEGMSAQDLAIPRIAILQSNSPQVMRGNEKFLKDAKAGDIIETATNRIFNGEEGITLIPVSYRRAYIEWVTREKGGGFVADHGGDSSVLDRTTKDEKKRDRIGDNQIVTTAEYYVIVVPDDEAEAPFEAVLSMTSTQLKKAKKWNTMMTTLRVPRPDGNGFFNPAMYYKSYKLTTVPESNDQGDWFGWVVAPGEDTLTFPNGEQLYLAARDFRNQVQSGSVRAVPHEAPEMSGGSGDDDL